MLIKRIFGSNKSGNIIVIVAASLLALIGAAAIATDVAYMFSVKAQLQTDADAAALAGASQLFDSMDPQVNEEISESRMTAAELVAARKAAVQKAVELAIANGVNVSIDGSFDPSDDGTAATATVTGTEENVSIHVEAKTSDMTVKVYISKDSTLFLARALDILDMQIAAQAVAKSGVPAGMADVIPIGISAVVCDRGIGDSYEFSIKLRPNNETIEYTYEELDPNSDGYDPDHGIISVVASIGSMDGWPHEGISYSIKQGNGNNETIVDTGTTGSEGIVEFYTLDPGDYKLVQNNLPADFTTSLTNSNSRLTVEAGKVLVVYVVNTDDSSYKGNYHALNFNDILLPESARDDTNTTNDGDNGGNAYRGYLENGYDGYIEVGSSIDTLPGVNAGTTEDGITAYIQAHGRVAYVPIVTTFKTKGGREYVVVEGYAAITITNDEDTIQGEIKGYLTKVVIGGSIGSGKYFGVKVVTLIQ